MAHLSLNSKDLDLQTLIGSDQCGHQRFFFFSFLFIASVLSLYVLILFCAGLRFSTRNLLQLFVYLI